MHTHIKLLSASSPFHQFFIFVCCLHPWNIERILLLCMVCVFFLLNFHYFFMHSHGIHSYNTHTHTHSLYAEHNAKRITFDVLHMKANSENTVLFDLILLHLLLFGMKRKRQQIINKKHTHAHMYTYRRRPPEIKKHSHTRERAHALVLLVHNVQMQIGRSSPTRQWNDWEYCTHSHTYTQKLAKIFGWK